MKTSISEEKIIEFINGIANSKTTIAFDLDGTLIYNEGTPNQEPNTPRYDVIFILQFFANIGCDVYVWSGGGIDYATRWTEKLGLDCTVVDKGRFIPDIAIDDEDVKLGKVNLKV